MRNNEPNIRLLTVASNTLLSLIPQTARVEDKIIESRSRAEAIESDNRYPLAGNINLK